MPVHFRKKAGPSGLMEPMKSFFVMLYSLMCPDGVETHPKRSFARR